MTLTADDLKFEYRQTALPEGWVIVEATFQAPSGEAGALETLMQAQIAKRDATQPTKERSAGINLSQPCRF